MYSEREVEMTGFIMEICSRKGMLHLPKHPRIMAKGAQQRKSTISPLQRDSPPEGWPTSTVK